MILIFGTYGSFWEVVSASLSFYHWYTFLFLTPEIFSFHFILYILWHSNNGPGCPYYPFSLITAHLPFCKSENVHYSFWLNYFISAILFWCQLCYFSTFSLSILKHILLFLNDQLHLSSLFVCFMFISFMYCLIEIISERNLTYNYYKVLYISAKRFIFKSIQILTISMILILICALKDIGKWLWIRYVFKITNMFNILRISYMNTIFT